MIQYDWEILSLYTTPSLNGQNNVVTRVTWRYQAKEGPHVGDIYRDTLLRSPSNPDQFIEYDSLSSETIVSWIVSIENMDEINAAVLSKLNEAKNPVVVEKTLPWDLESKFNRMSKFVLVHNDEVVYGPVHWHSDLMNRELKKLNIDVTIPEDILAIKQGIVPFNQPTAINESTKIYRVELQNEQPASSLYTNNGNIEWDFSTGVGIGTYVAIDKNFNEAKENLLNFLEKLKVDKQAEGTNVVINGNTLKIDTDPVSRLLLVEKTITMQENDTCNFKFDDNVWLTVTKTDIQYMLSVVNSYIQNLIDRQHYLHNQIQSCETVEQLRELERATNSFVDIEV